MLWHLLLYSYSYHTSSFLQDLPRKELFSDEQLALIIIDVLKKAETYGIIDIATILPGLISDLKPVVMKYIVSSLLSIQYDTKQLYRFWKIVSKCKIHFSPHRLSS